MRMNSPDCTSVPEMPW